MTSTDERPPTIDETKQCRSCGAAKPFSSYHLHSRNKRPAEAVCKECSNESKRFEYAKRNPPGSVRSDEQRARQRAADRAYIEKHADRKRASSHATYERNKDAVNARSRAWNKAHPEYQAARMAQRRSKAAAKDSHTAEDIKRLLALQKGKCAVCRCDIRKAFTVDHVLPLKLNGGNEKGNIQLLCRGCNGEKHAKHPVDYMQQKGFLL